MEDNELRQAIAARESYKERVEALSRQVQVLRVSLEEVTMSSDALKAFKNAKEGDDIADAHNAGAGQQVGGVELAVLANALETDVNPLGELLKCRSFQNWK